MDAATSPPTFGTENFGTARLGDKRRTGSLVDLADRLLRHPGGSLAVKSSDRRVFGLVGQILHRRADVPEGETPKQKRDRESRESLLWLRGVDALEPAPEGQLWVDVGDCLSDPFEFFDHEERLNRN